LKDRFVYSAIGAQLFILLLFTSLSSCKNHSEISKDKPEKESTEITDENRNMRKAIMLDYTNKPEGCEFLIQLEENNELLQFIDLPDEYKVNGTKIWLDFVRSRRPQGPCPLGTPITINDIKLRN